MTGPWHRTLLLLIVAVGVAGTGSDVVQGQTRPAAPAAAGVVEYREVFSQYCFGCHNERTRAGGLALTTMDLADVGANAVVWEKVVRKLGAGTMPPMNRPRPAPAIYDAVRERLVAVLDKAARTKNPGHAAAVRRLTRQEYQNMIRDLLALDLDVTALLPADNVSHGFDNMADFLTLSPSLLERYVSAARRIGRTAMALPQRAATETFMATRSASPALRTGWAERDDLPFGMAGGFSFEYVFPAAGEYSAQVKLHRTLNGYIRGLGLDREFHLYLDGQLVKRFDIKAAPGKAAPLGLAGTGAYGSPDWERHVLTADEHLQVRFPVTAGRHTVAVGFVGIPFEPEGERQPDRVITRYLDVQHGQPTVATVAISGPFEANTPFESPSRRAIFVCRPSGASTERACAETILARLARRAYRRPVTANDMKALLAFYETGRREGSFEVGIQFALERILVAPDFLLRIERDPGTVLPGTPYRLGDVELASRLSFFLWSSGPDDVLLDLVERGQLSKPPVLAEQVRRMLADERSAALVENFASQWLQLRNLRSKTPDERLFPDVDDNLKQDFERETLMFLTDQFRNDRSALDLLRADYSFLNEDLAKHYGVASVTGTHFRRVSFPDGQRGGLLGQASVLTLTSYPNRTSPVLRGKWVLEALLGTPPPRPPENVPALPDRGENGEAASVRQRLEMHRKNPICASCHNVMDPLGFALDHFDAVGHWREAEAGVPVDASATYPGSAKFAGLPGLRAMLLEREEQFVGATIERLLEYALGRPVQAFDMPTVREIRRAAASTEYRWSSLVLQIVRSTPFQYRVKPAPAAPEGAPVDAARP